MSAEIVATDIEERVSTVEVVDVMDDNEVYVQLTCEHSDNLVGMDDVCSVASEHGYVPCGIVESGASRFKPRSDADYC